jgi:hypothetical protein
VGGPKRSVRVGIPGSGAGWDTGRHRHRLAPATRPAGAARTVRRWAVGGVGRPAVPPESDWSPVGIPPTARPASSAVTGVFPVPASQRAGPKAVRWSALADDYAADLRRVRYRGCPALRASPVRSSRADRPPDGQPAPPRATIRSPAGLAPRAGATTASRPTRWGRCRARCRHRGAGRHEAARCRCGHSGRRRRRWVGRHRVGRHRVGRHRVGRHRVGRHRVGRRRVGRPIRCRTSRRPPRRDSHHRESPAPESNAHRRTGHGGGCPAGHSARRGHRAGAHRRRCPGCRRGAPRSRWRPALGAASRRAGSRAGARSGAARARLVPARRAEADRMPRP